VHKGDSVNELEQTTPPPNNRMERRRAKTRQSLLDAGMWAIGELGIHRLTISSITERADVALGSFYNHFDNREDFLLTLSQQAVTDWIVDIRRLRGDDFDDSADRICVAMVVLVRRSIHEPLWARFWTESLGRDLFQTTKELLENLEQLVCEGRDTGLFQIDEPGAVASMLLGIAHQCLLHVAAQDEPAADVLERTFATGVLRLLGLDEARLEVSVDKAIATTGNF